MSMSQTNFIEQKLWSVSNFEHYIIFLVKIGISDINGFIENISFLVVEWSTPSPSKLLCIRVVYDL